MEAPAKRPSLETWPIEKLIPYDRNPRVHTEDQVQQIKESIKEFGFLNPIIVASDAGILAGHGRLMAANQLGLREVPVIVADHLTDEQRKAFIIADNKIAANSHWDEEVLSELVDELDMDGFDLEILAFSLPELEELTVGTAPVKRRKSRPASSVPVTRVAPAPEPPKSNIPTAGEAKRDPEEIECPNCSHRFAHRVKVK